MTHQNRRSQSHDPFMMSGARPNDEIFGQNYNVSSRNATPVVQSIERDRDAPIDELAGYHPQVTDAEAMPPPRARRDSVASNMTDLNSPDVIASLVGPVESTDRPLNLGNSVLNKRARQSSVIDKTRAMSKQRDLASRLRTNDEQALMMTSSPFQRNAGMRTTPSGFSDALDAYETAQFSDTRPYLQYQHKRGRLSRDDELDWIKMEARRRSRRENRGRSMTPADDDESGSDPAAAVFSEIKRIYEAKRRACTVTVEEEVEYMKIQKKETARLSRQMQSSQTDTRASTPANADGMFVGEHSRPRGFPDFGGDQERPRPAKFPQRKFIYSSEARKKAKRNARAGQMPDRTDANAGPRRGYGDDGRGRNVDFGDYFLKATANEDRPDVIEIYLDHVSHEVAHKILTKGTMPVFTGTLLKDRLRKIRKNWNSKTKEFCRRHGIKPPPVNRTDEEEKRFNRFKWRTYNAMRGGRLTIDQASRFAVEANIEMCRWRAKYHQAIGNHNAATNLPDLSELDGLKLPTSEEYDEAYKPKFDKILEFVGQMFAECQDRIRRNHDRVHGVFPKVEIPDPYENESSDTEDEDPDAAATAAAAIAAAAAEKADGSGDANQNGATGGADAEDEDMFPEVNV